MAYDQRDELKLQVYMLWFKIVFFLKSVLHLFIHFYYSHVSTGMQKNVERALSHLTAITLTENRFW